MVIDIGDGTNDNNGGNEGGGGGGGIFGGSEGRNNRDNNDDDDDENPLDPIVYSSFFSSFYFSDKAWYLRSEIARANVRKY